MENFIRIKAESRHEVGKKIAKNLRKEGKIPAIIYGGDKESMPISLLIDDIKGILRSEQKENSVLKIQRDNAEVDAMLKEIQYDYLSEKIVHADFIRISMDKALTVKVPVEVSGTPIGVKAEDGLFDFMTREVKIKCLPTQIPRAYELDVTDMHVGQTIKAEDLELGEGVQLLTDSHAVICMVASKSKAADTEEEEEEAGEEEAAKEESAT